MTTSTTAPIVAGTQTPVKTFVVAATELPAGTFTHEDDGMLCLRTPDFPHQPFYGQTREQCTRLLIEARARRMRHLASCPTDAPLVLADVPAALAIAIERAALAGAR